MQPEGKVAVVTGADIGQATAEVLAWPSAGMGEAANSMPASKPDGTPRLVRRLRLVREAGGQARELPTPRAAQRVLLDGVAETHEPLGTSGAGSKVVLDAA